MSFTVASIISCFDSTSKTAKPPTTSLVSAKGPSITVTFPLASRTRLLIAVGASPPASNILPPFDASSLSFAMASINFGGGGPEFSACLTRVMNRILTSPFYLLSEAGLLIIEQFHPRLLLVSRTGDDEIDSRVCRWLINFLGRPELGRWENLRLVVCLQTLKVEGRGLPQPSVAGHHGLWQLKPAKTL